jgi:hypothetical protein
MMLNRPRVCGGSDHELAGATSGTQAYRALTYWSHARISGTCSAARLPNSLSVLTLTKLSRDLTSLHQTPSLVAKSLEGRHGLGPGHARQTASIELIIFGKLRFARQSEAHRVEDGLRHA